MEGDHQPPQMKMQSDDSTPLNKSIKRVEFLFRHIYSQQRVVTSLVDMATYSATTKNNKLREKSKVYAQKKVSQQTISALKSEIMEYEHYLSNIPTVVKEAEALVIRIQKKWEVVKNCLQNTLMEKYRPMQILLKEKIESIEKLLSSYDLDKQRSMSLARLVADDSTDYQMDKINLEIDSVAKQCDEAKLEIAELKESKSGLTAKLDQIRESNEEVKRKIQHSKEANADTISGLKSNAQIIKTRILEDSREIEAIEEKKIFLKEEQARLISSLNDITTKTEILNIELNHLKLMLKNEPILAEFQYPKVNEEQQQIKKKEQTQLELVEKIKEGKMGICALQNQLNVRRSQYEALKQIQNQILEREQYRTAAAAKLTALQVANDSKLERVHNLYNRIVDKKKRMAEFLKRRAQWLQHSRPAKIPSLSNETQVSSTTVGIPLLEEQDDERLQELNL